MSEWKSAPCNGAATCLELLPLDSETWLIRSSRDKGNAIAATTAEIQAFIAGVKAGEFDGLR